jgi:hypothetical protein
VIELPGAHTDITNLHIGQTRLEIDTDNNTITLEMPNEFMPAEFGGSKEFEYCEEEDYFDFDESDMFIISYDHGGIDKETRLMITRWTTSVWVTYSHVNWADGEEISLELVFEFDNETGNAKRYIVIQASDTTGAGEMSFYLQEEGIVTIEEFSYLLGSVSLFGGSYSVTDNAIRVFQNEELMFIGTLVNNNAITINVTTAENTGFAAEMAGKGVFPDGNILTLEKIG